MAGGGDGGGVPGGRPGVVARAGGVAARCSGGSYGRTARHGPRIVASTMPSARSRLDPRQARLDAAARACSPARIGRRARNRSPGATPAGGTFGTVRGRCAPRSGRDPASRRGLASRRDSMSSRGSMFWRGSTSRRGLTSRRDSTSGRASSRRRRSSSGPGAALRPPVALPRDASSPRGSIDGSDGGGSGGGGVGAGPRVLAPGGVPARGAFASGDPGVGRFSRSRAIWASRSSSGSTRKRITTTIASMDMAILPAGPRPTGPPAAASPRGRRPRRSTRAWTNPPGCSACGSSP